MRGKKKKPTKKGLKTQVTERAEHKKVIRVEESISVSELSQAMGVKAADLIRKLMQAGKMATINQQIDYDTGAVVAIGLEVRIGENSGMINIGVPSIIIKMLRQKFDQQWSVRKSESTEEERSRMLRLIKPSILKLDARLVGAQRAGLHCRGPAQQAEVVAAALHLRDAEPAGGSGGEGEGSIVCLGDAFDDCQAEADTSVVGAYAFGAANKRLDKRGN